MGSQPAEWGSLADTEGEQGSDASPEGVVTLFDEPVLHTRRVTLTPQNRTELSLAEFLRDTTQEEADSSSGGDRGTSTSAEQYSEMDEGDEGSVLSNMMSAQNKVIIRNIPPGMKPSELHWALRRVGRVRALKIFTADKFEAGIAPPPQEIMHLNRGAKNLAQVKKVSVYGRSAPLPCQQVHNASVDLTDISNLYVVLSATCCG